MDHPGPGDAGGHLRTLARVPPDGWSVDRGDGPEPSTRALAWATLVERALPEGWAVGFEGGRPFLRAPDGGRSAAVEPGPDPWWRLLDDLAREAADGRHVAAGRDDRRTPEGAAASSRGEPAGRRGSPTARFRLAKSTDAR